MTRYAENTTVGSDRSRAEIEKTLMRYGATGFLYGWQNDIAVVGEMTQELLEKWKRIREGNSIGTSDHRRGIGAQ